MDNFVLITQLTHFKIEHTSVNSSIINITWYFLEKERSQLECGRCFSMPELKEVLKFMNNHPENFPIGKNYHKHGDNEAPCNNTLRILPDEILKFPKYLMIREKPDLNTEGIIYNCMDIMLTDEKGNPKHSNNLEFNLIGKITNDREFLQ